MKLGQNFLWGGAMAANQCEGAAFEDGKGLSLMDKIPDAEHGRKEFLYQPHLTLQKITAVIQVMKRLISIIVIRKT